MKKSILLGTLLVLLSDLANAYTFRMEARGATSGLQVGDSVVVDVFMDPVQNPSTDLFASAFSLGVLFDPANLSYDPVASAALQVVYPAPPPSYLTTGAQPGYILYFHNHSELLYPVPAASAAGYFLAGPGPGRVDVAYDGQGGDAETYFFDTSIWIASMVFSIEPGASDTALSLSMTDLASFFAAPDDPGDPPVLVDPARISLSDPIPLTVPEPSSFLWVGLATLVVLRTRRR